MKRIYVLVSLLVLVAGLGTACGPKPTVAPTVTPTPVLPTPVPEVKETPEEEKYGGTLNFYTSQKIGVIDTTLTQATYLIWFANNLYASLVRYISGTWDIIPDLAAELPTISANGLEYTFQLKRGIKFYDGTPITAEDVVFSLKRAASDTSVWRARYEGVEDITAVDEDTVRITLRNPDPYFLHRLAGASSAILPKHAVEEYGEDFSSTVETTIGSGPYMLTDKTETELVFERNPYFYERPYADKVVVRVIPDATTQALEFDAGNVDWMFSILSPDIQEKYAADPAYEGSLKVGLSTAAFWVGLNPGMEPFTDIRVRQAIAHTFDREPIVEAGGQGVPAKTLIHPTLPGYDSKTDVYPTDLEKAKQLLAEAGYPDGVSFELYVWNIPGFIAMGEVMQQQLLDAGHKVELRVVDFGTMMAEVPKGTYAAFFNLGNIFVPDSAEFLYSLFHSQGAFNVNYQNEEVDRLLEEAVEETDIVRRGQLAAQADKLILQDAVAIPYQFRVTATLFQPWIRGHEEHNQTEASGQTVFRWSEMWIDKDQLPEHRK